MNSTLNASFSNSSDLYLLEFVSFYINDIVGFVLFTLGILFNVLSFTYFQLSRSFKDTSMRHYFSVISISDSLRLSEWLFAFLVDKKILNLNNFICRNYLFIIFCSGHISIWLLVFLSIERYIILQFPFTGKRIYTTKNSIRMLSLVISVLIVIDLPYLMPKFVITHYVDYDLHLVMCITNPLHRTYMFVNNVLIYALIPFLFLLIFNSLLISLLARQKTQFYNVIQSANASINAKRERQFKETTILLIVVTFFLLITVSPRYIIQMILMFTEYQNLKKIIIAKCLNVLEMLNFSFNFFFYIICSKTSFNELKLILYYFFYWKWSSKCNKIKICNHQEHFKNDQDDFLTISNNNNNSVQSPTENKSNFFNILKKKSRLKVYCFLDYSTRSRVSNGRPSWQCAANNCNTDYTNYNNLKNDDSIILDGNKSRFNSLKGKTSVKYNQDTKINLKLKNFNNNDSCIATNKTKNPKAAKTTTTATTKTSSNLNTNSLTFKILEKKKSINLNGVNT